MIWDQYRYVVNAVPYGVASVTTHRVHPNKHGYDSRFLVSGIDRFYPYLPGSLHCHWGNHTSYNNPRGSVATRKNMGWYHYINPISYEHSKGKHYKTACKFHGMYCTYTRADSRFAPSQWETALLCNDVSHWLGASLESALYTNASWTKKNCEYHSNAVQTRSYSVLHKQRHEYISILRIHTM